MTEETNDAPSVSMLVTSLAFDDELIGLISSFCAAADNHRHELIIVLKTDAPQVHLPHNVRVLVCGGRSRCFRKDAAARAAQFELLCFMDSDCRLPKGYFARLASVRRQAKVLRGRVNYLDDGTYFAKAQAEYRRLCDDAYFRLETFTPNLIVEKAFFFEIGGFDENNNLDSQDDYVLSEKIRRVLVPQLCDAIIVDCIADDRVNRTIRSWYGYGLGYGFRWWKYRNIDRSQVWTVPPLVVHASRITIHLPVLLLQWVVCWAGFLRGIVKFRRVSVFGETTHEQH